MRKSEIDDLLTAMLESHDNVSDLNVTVDRPLQVESADGTKTILRFRVTALPETVDGIAAPR